MPTPSEKIARFSMKERVIHWLAALSFLYAALTGLSLWTPQLYWLSSVFGGGVAVRWGHPWGGTLFAVVLGVMFLNCHGRCGSTAMTRSG